MKKNLMCSWYCYSPSLEGKYSEHGSTWRAQRAASRSSEIGWYAIHSIYHRVAVSHILFHRVFTGFDPEVLRCLLARRGVLSFGGISLFVGGDFQEGLVQRNVACRAELSRCKFVCWWRCPEGATKTSEQREERLTAERKWAAVKVSNERSKEREEHLRAKQEWAAAKQTRETSQEKELRLRARQEWAAAKQTRETSQEKELRLRARRERAALKGQNKSPLVRVETSQQAQLQRDSNNRWRNQRAAIFEARQNQSLHITVDVLTQEMPVYILKSAGLRKRLQPFTGSRKICTTSIGPYAKKHGHSLL